MDGGRLLFFFWSVVAMVAIPYVHFVFFDQQKPIVVLDSKTGAFLRTMGSDSGNGSSQIGHIHGLATSHTVAGPDLVPHAPPPPSSLPPLPPLPPSRYA